MKYFAPLFLSFFILSCGGSGDHAEDDSKESETVEVDSLVEVADSLELEPPEITDEHLLTILSKSDTMYAIPFTVDTVIVQNIEENDRDEQKQLNYENIQLLTKNLPNDIGTSVNSFYIDEFIYIDSLKAYGEYADYLSSIDIGMMQEMDAFVEGEIEIDIQRKLLLWSMTYSTYEACPYGYGTIVFGTYLNDGEVKNTVTLAEISGGGDPPVWGDTKVWSSVDESEILTSIVNRSGEEDYDTGEEIIEVIEDGYSLSYSEEGLKRSALN